MSSNRQKSLEAELTDFVAEIDMPAVMRPLYVDLLVCHEGGKSPENTRDDHGVLLAPKSYYQELAANIILLCQGSQELATTLLPEFGKLPSFPLKNR